MDKSFIPTSKTTIIFYFGLNIPAFCLENLEVVIGEFDFLFMGPSGSPKSNSRYSRIFQ
jgi:hypothetical protein